MAKPWYYYLLWVIAFIFIVIFSVATFPHLSINIPSIYRTLNKTVSIKRNTSIVRNISIVCNDEIKFRPDAPTSEFNIQIHEPLRNCFQPETDSRQLGSNLDFMWRRLWAPLYRRGCWAPTFSKIYKINKTLIIDCPPSMEPKYGFRTRSSVTTNYTGPVTLGNEEWIYTQCNLPFYSAPTVRLHLYAQPLPKGSGAAKQKPNVVFLQFDALGRQAMYRRMPRSYELLKSFSKTSSSSSSSTELRAVEGIEFPHLNVNGKNSEPNMRRVYCGSGNCQQTSLLRLYKQAGYSTSLLESYNGQLPNYVPSGVVDRVLASNYFGEYGGDTVQLYNQKSGCVSGTTWIVDEMLDYLYDRFIAMRQGGWFSINNILDSHSADELQNYAVVDSKLYDFVSGLNKSGTLDNTILILLGDHGLHGPGWKEFWREFDNRNPLLYILIGKNVKGATNIVKYLKANSDKLISHADIYMTFARFADISLPLTLPNTVNLFTENISGNRTCRTAGIPDQWCNCWLPKSCHKFEQ